MEEINTDKNYEPMNIKRGKLPIRLCEGTCVNNTLYKGVLFTFVSSVFTSMNSVLVKSLSELSSGQILFYRCMGLFATSLPIFVYKRQPFLGIESERLYLVLRSLFALLNCYFIYSAFKHLNIGEANIIMSCYPVSVSIFARLFLNEPCSLQLAIALLTTSLGLIITSKVWLEFDVGNNKLHHSNRVIGLSSAIAALVFSTANFITLRKLEKTDESLTVFTFSWIGTVVSFATVAIFDSYNLPDCGMSGLLVILLGIFSFFEQLLLALASRQEQASVVSTVKSSSGIVLTLIWDLIFFAVIPDMYSISGAVLVYFSVIIVGCHKWQIGKRNSYQIY